MRRVLMITPHFPPDSSAASHRVRLIVPYLASNGWEPTVLTVDQRDYEGGVEPALEALVPATVRVERTRAWSAGWTRRIGFGDLGLRAYMGLRSASRRILSQQRFDAVFITVYPVYPALLGPALKRRFGVKFVLDYQDPWVGSWGLTVGGGPQGAVDFRSRLSRLAGSALEPVAVRSADAITAVSQGTYDEIASRIPETRRAVRMALPLGWERSDEVRLAAATPSRYFSPGDGFVNLVYVGTILPNGLSTVRALLEALVQLRAQDPEAYARLRLWFLGTSNQFDPASANRVLPMAGDLGVADIVREVAPRIPYAEALSALHQAQGVLLLGSTEKHYTPSKVFPALIADRPIIAAFHEASSVVDMLKRLGAPTAVRLVTYGDAGPGAADTRCLAAHLAATARLPARAAGFDLTPIADVSASALAGRLCSVLDQICA